MDDNTARRILSMFGVWKDGENVYECILLQAARGYPVDIRHVYSDRLGYSYVSYRGLHF